MSAGSAFVVLARHTDSADDANLGAFGPYRSEQRAKQVHRALERATKGCPQPVEVVLLTLVPGPFTPNQAVEFVWPLVWDEDWEAGSTSRDHEGHPMTDEEYADSQARQAELEDR